MRLIKLNNAISVMNVSYDLISSLQGNTPLTAGTGPLNEYIFPGVTNNAYETLFSDSHRVEDVGNITLLYSELFLDFSYNGNGSIRFQISGDGGTTFYTMAEGNFNPGIQTYDLFAGQGTWLSSISPGDNKLQFRLQTKANTGTVDITMVDDSFVQIAYRKRVIT